MVVESSATRQLLAVEPARELTCVGPRHELVGEIQKKKASSQGAFPGPSYKPDR
jgi:hypothetical protein